MNTWKYYDEIVIGGIISVLVITVSILLYFSAYFVRYINFMLLPTIMCVILLLGNSIVVYGNNNIVLLSKRKRIMQTIKQLKDFDDYDIY